MTDAEKLRSIGRDYVGYDFAKVLFRIADLLDAVPPETLAAIRAGTWKAVPVEPTKDALEQLEFTYLCWLHPGARDYASSPRGIELARRMREAMISAAPAKPEG